MRSFESTLSTGIGYAMLALACFSACGEPAKDDSGNGGNGGTTAGTPATGGAGGTTAGTGGAVNAGAGPGGTGTSGGGSGGVAGTAAGASGASVGGVGAGGAGGAGGGSGGAAGATAGGVGGGAGVAGAGGGSGRHGGASGAFICTPGATYGNPLQGMGAITTINPPTSGSVTYFAFIEGPVWIGSAGKLFFSDNAGSPQERIFSLTPGGTPAVFMESSGSNGLAIDADDKLVLADQRNHRITRVDPTITPAAAVVVPAGSFTPNDIVVRNDGNLYFTDPNSAGRGFYRVSPTGAVTGPMLQVNNPNGIVLSPDENTLYVGDVQNRSITKFTLMADGTVSTASAAPFATATGNTVDGMAVDCAGNVYAGTASGVEVFTSTGTPIGTVPTGESSNATFGGTDRRTLYVTSRAVLKAVVLAVPGLPD